VSSLIPNDRARFYECSWVGQFRAIDADKAKLFAQAVADKAQEMGVHDVGYDVRVMPREVLTDAEARTSLIEHVRPASADQIRHPWEDGNFIFPTEHPLAEAEDRAYADWVRSRRTIPIPEQFQLEAGDGNEDD
jgi:hypothetical protein